MSHKFRFTVTHEDSGHVHVRVSSSPSEREAWVTNGTLIFSHDEWETFSKLMSVFESVNKRGEQ